MVAPPRSQQPLGRRQLFTYWRLGRDNVAAAVASLRACQHELQMRLPGLEAQLLQRRDNAELVTLMETYRIRLASSPSGLDDEQIAGIEAAAAAAVSDWLIGERHCEIFDEIDVEAP